MMNRDEYEQNRCPTCKYWVHVFPDPDIMGVCTILARPSGTVSTLLTVPGPYRGAPTLETSRHFGCTLHTPRAARAPAQEGSEHGCS